MAGDCPASGIAQRVSEAGRGSSSCLAVTIPTESERPAPGWDYTIYLGRCGPSVKNLGLCSTPCWEGSGKPCLALEVRSVSSSGPWGRGPGSVEPLGSVEGNGDETPQRETPHVGAEGGLGSSACGVLVRVKSFPANSSHKAAVVLLQWKDGKPISKTIITPVGPGCLARGVFSQLLCRAKPVLDCLPDGHRKT